MPEAAEADPRCWYALWTRSNCEQRVYDQLAPKGFEVFLPTVESWCRRGGVRRLARQPLFRGFLFLHHAMDRRSYLDVCTARGLVRILGDRWDRLAVVAQAEIDAIRAVLDTGLPITPHPYLHEGQRIRITRGPLADVEGVFIKADAKKGLFVVSVELLRRSVAVQIECTMLEAA